jgi:exodeoxyribonuclease V alpha subunit
LEELTCQITSIFYQDEKSGYIAFAGTNIDNKEEIKASGTITGSSLAPGDRIALRGIWFNHKTYGHQFQVKQWKIIETDRELNRFKIFLSSGAIRGIGPHMAAKILKIFGQTTPQIFESDINQLKRVDGIGNKVFDAIVKSWEEVKHHHFLYGLGISGKQVKKIIEKYGSNAEETVKKNPYILAEQIDGIGFTRADQIAKNLGIEKESPFRIRAALIHNLKENNQNGHCYLPEKNLIFITQQLTEVPKELIQEVLNRAIKDLEICKEKDDLVGTRHMSNTERAVATKLRQLAGPSSIIDEAQVHSDCLELAPFQLDPLQVEAIKTCLLNKVSIITGFPGSGKSLCTKTIVNILDKHHISFHLLAPTGRASKRLAEVTGYPASTIHRFICQRQNPQGEFRKDSYYDSPEPSGKSYDDSGYTVFIVDESSMIDIFLLRNLIEEIDCHVVFIGDIDQLPPVGPGNTLKDLIDSEKFPVVKLTKIFRQEEGSAILEAAFQVNEGKVPDFTKNKSECRLIPIADSEKICEALTQLVTDILPTHYPKYDIRTQVQILSPYNKGKLGSVYLNEVLQKVINPQEQTTEKNYVECGPYKFYQGDKVIQTVNDYDRDIFNGDMGIVTKIYPQYDELTVEFPHTIVRYTPSELADLRLAYIISCHKAQGSEIPVVIMILHESHYNLLQRNLLYTGITRAQKLLIMISTPKVLKIAAENNKVQERFTLLKERIRGEIANPVYIQ